MKNILAVLLLLASSLAWGQAPPGAPKTLTVTVNSGTPPSAALPLTWANSHPDTGATYSVTKHIPGDYAATCAGAQQAITDWVAAPDQWWHIIVTHGSLLTISAAQCITLQPKIVGGGQPTKYMVWESDTPLTVGQTACSHGMQDNLAASSDPGIRNADCNGSGTSYQLGNTVTSISSGSFILANGTVTSTSAYNDVASMWTAECTVNGCSAIAAGNWDVNGNGPGYYIFRDMEARPGSSVATPNAPINVDDGAITLKNLSNHIVFDRVWVHGDATDASSGNNVLPDAAVLTGSNVAFVNSQISKAIRAGGEGHCLYANGATTIKIVHNWIEGCSSGWFTGGVNAAAITGAAVIDVQNGRNRYTYPHPWLGNGDSGGICGVGNSCSRKNAQEHKGAIREVNYGNIWENVDNSGAQNGPTVNYNVRACSNSTACDDYAQVISDVTFEYNILRNACRGFGLDGSSGAPTAGVSVAHGMQNIVFHDNLVYNISKSNLGCNTASTTITFKNASSGHTWTGATVTRNSGGTVASVALATGTGQNQAGVAVGDPVFVYGCADTSFNAGQFPFVSAIAPTTYSGTTVYYANFGTPSASTTCNYRNDIGYPNLVLFQHNTMVGDFDALGPDSSITTATTASYHRSYTITDNIFTGSGFIDDSIGEGTRSENYFDTTTLIYHHNVQADRTAPSRANSTAYKLAAPMQPTTPARRFVAVTSGTSAGSQPSLDNTHWACDTDGTVSFQEGSESLPIVGRGPDYTEYRTGGSSGIQPPITIFFPNTSYCYGATADATCVGFTGGLSAPVSGTNACSSGTEVAVSPILTMTDWHNYALHSSSQYKGAASDGADLGISSATGIDAVETAPLYTCKTACGAGPYPD